MHPLLRHAAYLQAILVAVDVCIPAFSHLLVLVVANLPTASTPSLIAISHHHHPRLFHHLPPSHTSAHLKTPGPGVPCQCITHWHPQVDRHSLSNVYWYFKNRSQLNVYV
ncbi:uncharacterized protein HD556DRAFT_250029 [Suillus plorans]|uniref:Uncharacterized protein n=1 Tax=Suillus plorans TaxID=116603 RepID=A0A9P7IYF1_9AGAM|nr:uncharacterized protein HD556DRAFT_250029 [Suillus plorans]KAG1797316.1 hypothetical protein HD556DRAFT_250029 [Suillus plorans]